MEKQGKKGASTAGRWTRAENDKFMQALEKYGRDWVKVQKKVKTRSLLQIRSHAQKVFLNMSQDDIRAFIGSDSDSFNNHQENDQEFQEKQISDVKIQSLKVAKTKSQKKEKIKEDEHSFSHTNVDEHLKSSNDNFEISCTKDSQKVIVSETNQKRSQESEETQNFQSLFLEMYKQNQEYFLKGGELLGLICKQEHFYPSFCFPYYSQYSQF